MTPLLAKLSGRHTRCVAAIFLLTAAAYAEDENTEIRSVPFTISAPGVYRLTKNLKYSADSGVAITIKTSNVTLDLGGYSLQGSGNHPSSTIGIQTMNASNVVVENGHVGGFDLGINLTASGTTTPSNQSHLVQKVQLSNNRVAVIGEFCTGSVVKDCQVSGLPPATNFYTAGIYFVDSQGNRVENNTVSGGGCVFGVLTQFSTSDYAESNFVYNCQQGVSLSLGDKYRANTTTGCQFPFSGGTAVNAENN